MSINKYRNSLFQIFKKFLGDDGSLRRQFFHGGIGCSIVKFFGITLSFLVSILLARILGPKGFGAYSFSYSLIILLSIPVQVGLPQLVIRETAKNYAYKKWQSIKGIWRWSTFITLIFSTTAIVIGALLIELFYKQSGAQREVTLLIALVLIPLFSLCAIKASALKGLHHVVIGQLPDNILRPFIFLILILFLFFSINTEQINSSTIMATHVIAAILSLALCSFFLYRLKPKQISEVHKPEYQIKQWFSATLPLAFIAGMQLIIVRTDIIMLGLFSNDEVVGIYRVSTQFAFLLSLPLEISHMLFAPYVARFLANNDKHHLQNMIKFSSIFVFFSNTIIFLSFLFFGRLLLSLFFGPSYLISYYPMLILAFGRFVNSVFGPVGMVLQMGGYEKDALLGVSFAAMVNIILNLILIPSIGIIGASIATGISLITSHLIMYCFVLKKVGIESSALPKPGLYKRQPN